MEKVIFYDEDKLEDFYTQCGHCTKEIFVNMNKVEKINIKNINNAFYYTCPRCSWCFAFNYESIPKIEK